MEVKRGRLTQRYQINFQYQLVVAFRFNLKYECLLSSFGIYGYMVVYPLATAELLYL